MDRHKTQRGRNVPRIRLTHRFHLVAEGAGRNVERNPATATETLRLARLLANTGMTVYVRDRTVRRLYLDEAALEREAAGEANA